ncbi:hypothetical protein Clacol_000236 [Clathrus columnatus]|uniref:Cyclopropane-fatty-acyl-phospholipid synthase n=1 Tax=Clathrus columnatus TaxID=1419009 RepID=A0AAV4ZY37_9AGAM|nr:hypothetical protein Clacol_000236 [Clathrus columnatus]
MSSSSSLLYKKFISYAFELPTSPAKKSLVESLRRGIKKGSLRIIQGEEKYIIGTTTSENKVAERAADIIVKRDDFWLRLWLDNRDLLEGYSSMFHAALSGMSAIYIRFFGQTLTQASFNASTGYDCSNDFFKIFLSEDMTYSSAIWSESNGGIRGDIRDHGEVPENALKEAQLMKLHTVLGKARLQPGDRLLEFGSGWGSMAIEAAKLGCTVDTITLSIEQKNLAEIRIKEAGFSSQITVHLVDYRNLPPEFEHAFDAFVSVEMIEAVGLRYLPDYFKIVDWALKPGKGAAVIVSTTQPESRHATYQPDDYARRYQWPNSFIPSVSGLISLATTATKANLIIDSVTEYGLHYPRTLREWGRRLQKNWNPEVIQALQERYPEMKSMDKLEFFKRKWEYMYVYAEVGYATAYTTLHHFCFVRPNQVKEPCQ